MTLSCGKVERKKAYHTAAMRWHPDKFTQRFGSRLTGQDREQVLERVKGIYQSLQEEFARHR